MLPHQNKLNCPRISEHRAVATQIRTPRRRLIPHHIAVSIITASTLTVRAVDADTNNAPAGSFADLSVEQLMNVSVTSVTKHESKLSDSAAAISVITQDDIRRL